MLAFERNQGRLGPAPSEALRHPVLRAVMQLLAGMEAELAGDPAGHPGLEAQEDQRQDEAGESG